MDTIYKVIEIIGSSEKSWEDAAKSAVESASKSLKELRVAEVKELDLSIDEGNKIIFRTKLKVSFKYVP